MTTVDTSQSTNAAASYWFRQFQLQQDTNQSLQSQLRKSVADAEDLRSVLAEVRALHHESLFMTSVPFCNLCVERWPCKSERAHSRLDNVLKETKTKGESL